MVYKKLSSESQIIDYYFPVEGVIYEDKSDNLNLAEPIHFSILKLKNLGRCLVIQNDIQLIEWGEEKYHEPLVHTPMSYLDEPQKALVLGGGDGGICRELLKYKSIKQITLVEISPEIVEACKTYMPFVGEALKDKKVKILNENACNFIKETKEKFDIIFIDTTDFNSTEDSDSSQTNLRDIDNIKQCKNILNKNGIITYNDDYCGVSSNNTLERVFSLRQSFNYCKAFCAPVPYFFSGKYSFVMCSEGINYDLKIIDWREKQKIKTKFYDKKTHEASFCFDKDFNTLDKPTVLKRNLGHSLTIDMLIEDSDVLLDHKSMIKHMRDCCSKADLNVLNEDFFEFTPQGLTAVLILSESHLSCHTWPEYNRVCFDLFCCSSFEKIEKAKDSLLQIFNPKKVEISLKERSV